MIHKHILYNNFSGHKFEVSKAEGALVYDTEGNEYLDFTSGWNVANLGWNHSEINAAIQEQVQKGTGIGFWHSIDIQNQYAKELTQSLPKELNTCIRATSGTEAVEVAIKVARSYTGRKTIIGFKETYHGQLFASMALGTPDSQLTSIDPMVPSIEQLNYPISEKELESFLNTLEKRIMKGDVAALVSEPGIVTGWGTVLLTAEGYLKRTQTLLQKYNVLLIVDEVGSGFSRTGTLFGIEQEEVVPDIIVLGKAIANGAGTIATTVIKEHLSEPAATTANLTSTFSWNPLAAAAALKTLQIHKRDKTWVEATAKGKIIIDSLREFQKSGSILDIRGRGLEIGLEMKDKVTCDSVIQEAQEKGLLLIGDGENFLQLMPSLTITGVQLDKALAVLASVLSNK
jgi:4-aminobutyrate aminotransferase-like enzyme